MNIHCLWMYDMDDLIKQDIDFLESPLWMQNFEQNELGLTWKDKQGYIYKTTYKAPVRTDMIVLYYLLLKVQENNWNRKLELSKYEILNYCGLGLGKRSYERLEDTLMRWTFLRIGFKNILYGGENKSGVYGVIHEYEWPEDGKSKVKIELSEKFLERIKDSEFYKLINFNEIKALKTPLATRLYEILGKTFKGRNEWSIDAHKLANKIPMQEKYLTHIIAKIKPAINRINKKTTLNLNLEIRKKEKGTAVLVFRLINKQIATKPEKKKLDFSTGGMTEWANSPKNRIKTMGKTTQEIIAMMKKEKNYN